MTNSRRYKLAFADNTYMALKIDDAIRGNDLRQLLVGHAFRRTSPCTAVYAWVGPQDDRGHWESRQFAVPRPPSVVEDMSVTSDMPSSWP